MKCYVQFAGMARQTFIGQFVDACKLAENIQTELKLGRFYAWTQEVKPSKEILDSLTTEPVIKPETTNSTIENDNEKAQNNKAKRRFSFKRHRTDSI